MSYRPPYSNIEPGWNDGYSFAEAGSSPSPYPTIPLPIVASEWIEFINYQLPQGQQIIDIPFEILKVSANYVAQGAGIENTIDASPLVVGWEITGRSIAGFQIALDAELDSDNYFFRGIFGVIG